MLEIPGDRPQLRTRHQQDGRQQRDVDRAAASVKQPLGLDQRQHVIARRDATERRVAGVVRQLGAGREPRLNHGDLRLKNLLVDYDGRISAIIDWEFALAGPAPEWDLALALNDLSIGEKDAFIEGYGLDVDDLASATPALVALNMLHYAPYADAAERAGDDRQLCRYRRRFARAYDLYSI